MRSELELEQVHPTWTCREGQLLVLVLEAEREPPLEVAEQRLELTPGLEVEAVHSGPCHQTKTKPVVPSPAAGPS
jgi:hypothetical protein